MQQILKKMIEFGLYMFIISSCGWLLWSYLIDIVCLDGDKTGFVEVDPPLNILEVMVVSGVTMLVLNSSGWHLWSYVVEILSLDTDKTGCVNKVILFNILLFFEGSQIPTWCRI